MESGPSKTEAPVSGLQSPVSGYRAVFLDRDGVINRMVYHTEFGLVDSPQNPGEFELLPGAAEAIRRLNELGLLSVIASNQPGIAKGKTTPALLDAVTAKMHAELAKGGAHLDAVYYCLHHPQALLTEHRVSCDCRKPESGLLLRAAREHAIDLRTSFMIGDGLTDVLAGRAAGCTTLFLGDRKCEVCCLMEERGARPDYVLPNLTAAIELVEQVIRRPPASTPGLVATDSGRTEVNHAYLP
jgi:D-glycero-D-manno-heptose 1,7-bisphosphate phosphatase